MRSLASAVGAGLLLVVAGWAPPVALAGDGTFPDSLATSVSVDELQDVALGDFNNDGRQDLVAAQHDPTTVSVLIGFGDGTFVAPTPYTVGCEASAVAVADFNGDGNEDIAAVGGDDDVLSILRGNGNGTFQPKLDSVLSAPGDAIAVSDFNGDGLPDLAITQDNDTVTWRTGNGDATFAVGANLSTGHRPESVAVGDFDGDGDEDLATGDTNAQAFNGAGVSIRFNNGTGAFGGLTTVALDNGGDSVTAFDADADGDDDLAVRRQQGIAILKSNGAGAFTRTEFDAGGSVKGIAVADANSDGNPDLIATEIDGKTAVLLGDGSGAFGAPAVHIQGSADSVGRPVVGDFNADGNQDFAYANTQNDRVMLRGGAGPPADAGNLLVNGGGEAATGSSATRAYATQAPAIPGWTLTGSLTNVRYGIYGGFIPRLASGPVAGQEAYFSGGTGATGAASQSVDVSGSAASIDAGLATVRLTGFLGGYRTSAEGMAVTAAFSGALGEPLGGPLQIGPVTAVDRHNLTTLLRRSATGAVPVGTRAITVTMSATRVSGAYDSAFADRIGLFLDAPAPPPTPPPGGDDPSADTTPPETTITKEPKAKSSKAKAKYKFTSSEPNSTFECKLDKGKFKTCDAGKIKYKRLDFGKHKFQVVATDAAGNTDPSPDKDKFKRKP